MEIDVTGYGEKKFAPDTVCMTLTFQSREKTYEKAFEKGSEAVSEFIEKVMYQMGMEKEELISSYLNVSLQKVYNEETRRYEDDGYLYEQSADLEFALDMKKVAEIIDLMKGLKLPPEYNVQFSLKNERAAQNEVISIAMQDALLKAGIIAESAGLSLGKCRRADLNHTGNRMRSNSVFDVTAEEAVMGSMRMNKAVMMDEIYTPREVTVSQTVYCIYEATEK